MNNMNNTNIVSLLFPRRYFHLVALRIDSQYSIREFWNDCEISVKRKEACALENSEFIVSQNTITSDIRFYNTEDDFSINQNGEPPFHYDIFAILLKQSNLLIVGFPFRLLAKSTIANLISHKSLLKKGNFVKANLNNLIKVNPFTDFFEENFTSYFSSLDLTLTGDTNITSVNLDGDKPLESTLYKSVFLKLINEDECKLERCTLKCETTPNNSNNIIKSKANIHVDQFGNYKFYIHGSGKNIITIPYIFTMLNKYECLESTLINPINRLHEL